MTLIMADRHVSRWPSFPAHGPALAPINVDGVDTDDWKSDTDT